ncbi:geranylgeranyl reductase family protein [soil metagenome]
MGAEFDVVVVGGGPGGAACALELARRGHSVLVCEKKTFPREKACGDGLTPRAVRELDAMGLGREVRTWERVRGLRAHGSGRTLELPFPEVGSLPAVGFVKSRRDLDATVLGAAEAAGAKVLFDMQVSEPIFEEGVVRGVIGKVGGQTEQVRARYVVCAEGSATKFSRALGRERVASYPIGLAVRQYFRAPSESPGWFDAFLTLRLGEDHLPGYGWIFPVGDGKVNAGVGLLSSFDGWRAVNLHHLQSHFVDGLGAQWGVSESTVCSKPRAGRLFMGGSPWPPHGQGFVLVGDAAGMIKQCKGEGIAYAYETGRIAARHIAHALATGGRTGLEGYTRELETVYGPYYRLGRRFISLIGNPALMERFVSTAMTSKKLMSWVFVVLGNLEDERASGAGQKGFKMLRKLAEMKP